MFGCDREEIARASRSNRALRSGSEERCEDRTLIATVRSSRVSRARYTSPMPPAPSGATISYGPSFVPDVSGIDAAIIPARLSTFRASSAQTLSRATRVSGEERLSETADYVRVPLARV